MEKLPELKTQLSNELKKPKKERNLGLINSIHEQIKEQKALLHKEYRKREKEKRNAEIKLKMSLWKKKTDEYAKLREEKKKEIFEHEKHQREKLQKKNKVK